jgi:hypothetical protein
MFSRGFDLGFGISEHEVSAMLKSETGEGMDPTFPFFVLCAA